MAIMSSYVIEKKKPGLLLLHLFAGDSDKHRCGTGAPSVKAALERYDLRIGEVMAAAKKAGIFEKTAFLIVSDHGQSDVNYRVHLNNLFLREGLLTAEGGKLISWRAYADSCGTSAAIHVDGEETLSKVLPLLEQAIRSGGFGIERILNRAELNKIRYGEEAALSVEAAPGYAFVNALSGGDVTALKEAPKGDHGDLPEKEQSYFLNRTFVFWQMEVIINE
jgi:predicted AlkP superfamily pyrophosphatase or phosphodiesterase